MVLGGDEQRIVRGIEAGQRADVGTQPPFELVLALLGRQAIALEELILDHRRRDGAEQFPIFRDLRAVRTERCGIGDDAVAETGLRLGEGGGDVLPGLIGPVRVRLVHPAGRLRADPDRGTHQDDPRGAGLQREAGFGPGLLLRVGRRRNGERQRQRCKQRAA